MARTGEHLWTASQGLLIVRRIGPLTDVDGDVCAPMLRTIFKGPASGWSRGVTCPTELLATPCPQPAAASLGIAGSTGGVSVCPGVEDPWRTPFEPEDLWR